MRVLGILVAAVLVGGCATIEQIRHGYTGSTFDPNKIYVRNDSFTVSKRTDMDRFVCMTGPLQCASFGLSWNCDCP